MLSVFLLLLFLLYHYFQRRWNLRASETQIKGMSAVIVGGTSGVGCCPPSGGMYPRRRRSYSRYGRRGGKYSRKGKYGKKRKTQGKAEAKLVREIKKYGATDTLKEKAVKILMKRREQFNKLQDRLTQASESPSQRSTQSSSSSGGSSQSWADAMSWGRR